MPKLSARTIDRNEERLAWQMQTQRAKANSEMDRKRLRLTRQAVVEVLRNAEKTGSIDLVQFKRDLVRAAIVADPLTKGDPWEHQKDGRLSA